MDLKKIYLDYLTKTLSRQCNTTRKHIDQYRPVFANNRNVAGFSASMKELTFTMSIRTAAGSHFQDADGNDYLDMSMGFGVHLFGHRPALIEDAIQKQIEKGITLGPMFEDAAMVSRLIHELTGNDRCAFYNSGTEAVMVAMRIARAATEKNKVVIFEGSYHGTHDSLLGLKTDEQTHVIISTVPGITQSAVNETLILHYGSADSLEIIRKFSNEIAAVLVEPVMSRHPELASADFLEQLRIVCTETNIALIFDEVITGFRAGNGGVAALFQIQPDIVTYGKIAGGGLPIGIVAGKQRFMDMIDGGQWQFGDATEPKTRMTFTAGTFNHHPLAMAAAKAVLQLLKDKEGTIQEALNKLTKEFCNELNEFYTREGFPLSMVYFSSLFRFLVKGNSKIIFYSLLKENIYIWEGRNCFLSTAHSMKDLKYLKEKVKQCCFEMEAAGILHSKRHRGYAPKSLSICAGIQINKLLEIEKFLFACHYLFTAIPKLRRNDCVVIDEDKQADEEPDNVANAQFRVIYSCKQDRTSIKVYADKSISDGWSLILFFKSLSRSYNALIHALPLPVIDYEEENSIPSVNKTKATQTCIHASTVHATIPMETVGDKAGRSLFALLLSRFQKAVTQENDDLKLNVQNIFIPVAGQIQFRRLKAFGQLTIYKQISFKDQVHAETIDDLDLIERQMKSHNGQPTAEETYTSLPDVVFNMDNLDFHLDFDGEKAIFLTVDETETFYPLVCNVTKLNSELAISIKYAVNKVSAHHAKKLLACYISCLQQKMYENL